MTHDAFAVSARHDGRSSRPTTASIVQILKGGDAGEMVNQAILTKDAPLADVLYGVDNTFLSRALDAGIFDAVLPRRHSRLCPTSSMPARAATVTPIDYGDVCVNYDKAAFLADGPAPTTLEQLTDPIYRSKLVVENPATSSPGLAFMLATIGRFGETGDYTWRDYWSELRANDVRVAADWETAYYSTFSGGAGEGERPIVVSYATSPVAEVVFADPPVTEAPTAVLNDGCFRQVEYAGVLHGGESASARA